MKCKSKVHRLKRIDLRCSRCPSFPVIQDGCVLKTDPRDSCCQILDCPPKLEPGTNILVPPIRGVITGGNEPRPNGIPSSLGGRCEFADFGCFGFLLLLLFSFCLVFIFIFIFFIGLKRKRAAVALFSCLYLLPLVRLCCAVNFCLFLTLSLSASHPLSVSLSLCFCLCLCLSVSLPLSFSLSHTHTHTHTHARTHTWHAN